MTMPLIPFLIGLAVILSVEWIMWRLFLRRVGGVHFAPDVDASAARFFTLSRIRVCVIAHTVFLAALLYVILVFLW
jgi:hypothetical protein